MNEEGISSLPVLDNQKNVVGNISHVDVKVRDMACSQFHRTLIDLASLAINKVELSSAAELFMHSLHNCYSPRAGTE